MLTVGSLFSGIGGIDLGLERAGMTIRWQVEKDDWCRRVLSKHWPDVPKYEDITTLTGHELERVDVLAGGFPCQPASVAGTRKGNEDVERWLWPHFGKLIRVLRPQIVLVENVPGLFTVNGGAAFGEIIGSLASMRYDCEWDVISAADVGAPHLRKRVWIVAHADRAGLQAIHEGGLVSDEKRKHTRSITRRTNEQPWFDCNGEVAYADSEGLEGVRGKRSDAGRENTSGYAGSGSVAVADTGCESERPDSFGSDSERFHGEAEGVWSATGDRSSGGCKAPRRVFDAEIGGEWEPEPNIRRVSHGVPKRVDRLRGLGNAVVPQIVEWIGQRILAIHDHAEISETKVQEV